MQRPLIGLSLAYAAGILLGFGFLYFPLSILSLVLTAFIILIGMAVLRRFSLKRFLLLTLPCLAGGAAYLFSAVWVPDDHYTRIVMSGAGQHILTGKITSALDRDTDRTAFILSLERIDSERASGKVRVSVREALTNVGYGDRVRLSGKLFEPQGFRNPRGFDYAAYLAQNGIARMTSIRGGSRLEVMERGTGLFRTIQDWREGIRQAFLASLSGPGSAILQAMVLGEEGALTDELRDRFLAAGVTHIISISGSHLGMLALICFGLLRLLMRLMPERRYHHLTLYTDPKKIAALMTLPLVVFYTLLAGGQIATVRSLLMIAAAMAAVILDRDNALLHALALAGCLILLASPQALFDISFQLSFISVWTIGSVVLLRSELQLHPAGKFAKIGQSVFLIVIISLSASIATGPLVARYFNQVSFSGLLANMVVVPFAGMVVVPLGLGSGVLSLFTGHLPLAWLNQFLADRFIEVVTFFSKLPFAEVHPPSPGILWLCCYTLLVSSLFLLLRSWLRARFKPLEYSTRISRPYVLVALSSAFVLALLTAWPLFSKQPAEVCFPDVGQGDSALASLPGGRHILIDGGGTYDGHFDVGRRVLAPYLWNKGIRSLDLVILSHPHPDHMNGLQFVLEKFAVSELWTHGLDQDLPGYAALMRIAADRHIPQRIPAVSDPPVLIGPAELRVLHPAPRFRSREKKAYSAENDRSLVLRVDVGGCAMLFAGDIGAGAERTLLQSGPDLACDLIKVPHHGSKTSSSADFVQAVHPQLAVFTVGRENRYRHPSEEVVAIYAREGAQILRTDQDGAICVQMGDEGFQETTWRERELRRIGLTKDVAAERENWKRLRIRIWEL